MKTMKMKMMKRTKMEIMMQISLRMKSYLIIEAGFSFFGLKLSPQNQRAKKKRISQTDLLQKYKSSLKF